MRLKTIRPFAGMIASIALSFTIAAPFSLAQSDGNGHDLSLRGYSQANARTQIAWEAKMRAVPKPELLREYMKHLSAEPHHLGSAYDKQNAEWIRDKFKSWGIDAKLEESLGLIQVLEAKLAELEETDSRREP